MNAGNLLAITILVWLAITLPWYILDKPAVTSYNSKFYKFSVSVYGLVVLGLAIASVAGA